MAKIARNEEQYQELKKVNNLISEISDINILMNADSLQISAVKTDNASEKCRPVAFCFMSEQDNKTKTALTLLRQLKEKKAAEIKRIAKANQLVLSEEDIAIIC